MHAVLYPNKKYVSKFKIKLVFSIFLMNLDHPGCLIS